MKKMMVVLFSLVFAALVLGGCGNPCEKSFNKWKECMKKAAGDEGVKEADKNKDEFMKKCKKDKGPFKKCLAKKDCKEFDRCIESIGK
jgi:hypothetical protein